jgi:hypothetical protein
VSFVLAGMLVEKVPPPLLLLPQPIPVEMMTAAKAVPQVRVPKFMRRISSKVVRVRLNRRRNSGVRKVIRLTGTALGRRFCDTVLAPFTTKNRSERCASRRRPFP